MKLSSLCYLEKDGKYLMLFRNKKKLDCNEGKWIGVGGKFEENESPDECVCREVLEETGITLLSCRMRGIVTFISDTWETEYMHLFTSDSFVLPEGAPDGGIMPECDEGLLEWIPIERVPELPLWEGDRIFLRLLRKNEPFFLMTLKYQGDSLVSATLNGRKISK